MGLTTILCCVVCRLAPLSEGRIHESGHLQCTYHGWQFDASGSCTNIPQIGDDKAHATACSSPRACVETYPVQVLQDMLWVFADSSVEGWIAARTENDGELSLICIKSCPQAEVPTVLATKYEQPALPHCCDSGSLQCASNTLCWSTLPVQPHGMLTIA